MIDVNNRQKNKPTRRLQQKEANLSGRQNDCITSNQLGEHKKGGELGEDRGGEANWLWKADFPGNGWRYNTGVKTDRDI